MVSMRSNTFYVQNILTHFIYRKLILNINKHIINYILHSQTFSRVKIFVDFVDFGAPNKNFGLEKYVLL